MSLWYWVLIVGLAAATCVWFVWRNYTHNLFLEGEARKRKAEMEALEAQRKAINEQIAKNKLKIDDYEKQIRENKAKGSLEVIQVTVEGMTEQEVRAELKRRGVL